MFTDFCQLKDCKNGQESENEETLLSGSRDDLLQIMFKTILVLLSSETSLVKSELKYMWWFLKPLILI